MLCGDVPNTINIGLVVMMETDNSSTLRTRITPKETVFIVRNFVAEQMCVAFE